MAKVMTGLRVVQENRGRQDGGVWHRPQWSLTFFRGETPCRRPVKCGGENRPLGGDLENACKGLGLSVDEIYAIPVVPLD